MFGNKQGLQKGLQWELRKGGLRPYEGRILGLMKPLGSPSEALPVLLFLEILVHVNIGYLRCTVL